MIIKEEIGENTYRCLQMLYQNSKYMQRYALDTYRQIDRNSLCFAKEYATIKLCTSRQSGHTTAIARFLENDAIGNWIVLMYNLQMVDMFERNFNPNKKHTITSSLNNCRGLEANGIIIDTSSLFSQSKIHEIYDVVNPCMFKKKYRYFIFVQ